MGRKAAHHCIVRASIYNETKGRKAAHQFVMWPKAAKWLIIVSRDLYPVFGKYPEFGKLNLVLNALTKSNEV